MSDTKKKKIVIIHPFFGIYNRGTETFFMEITNYLKKYYDITVFSEKSDPTIAENIVVIDGYNEKDIHTWYSKFYDKSPWLQRILNKSRYLTVFQPIAFYYRKFARRVWKQHLKNESYDLMFASMGAQGAALADKYRKKTGCPFVYKGGGGIGPGERKTLEYKPDCFICVSTPQKRWASKYHDKLDFIPNGTYIERFTKIDERAPFHIREGHKLVLAVGNLDMDFKRMQLVIEAMALVPEADLLILGRGKDEERLRKLAEEKLPGRHKIMGVHYSETPYYYRSADMFTLASLYEPFGIVYIEAMASNLPIVTTNDEVRREIVGEAGMVCDVTNANEYAETIRKVLAEDYGNTPSERAKLYDYSYIGEKYHELFESLMK